MSTASPSNGLRGTPLPIVLVGAGGMRRGLLVYPMQGCVDGVAGDHLLIAPPAVMTAEQIGWAVAQLSDAVRESAQT